MDRDAARRVGLLAQDLYHGYMADRAVLEIAGHPMADQILDLVRAANRGPASVPIARIERKDGTCLSFDVAHARFKLLGAEPKRPAHFTGPAGRLEVDGKTVRDRSAALRDRTRPQWHPGPLRLHGARRRVRPARLGQLAAPVGRERGSTA